MSDLDYADYHLEANCGGDLYLNQLTRTTTTLTAVDNDGSKARILITPDDAPGFVHALIRSAGRDRAVKELAEKLGIEPADD